MAQLRIGTSGWTYSHWRERFYPKGLRQSDWLSFYAQEFDTVEINASFYRLPRPENVERWRSEVPEGFLFACKGSRYLTHVKRLADTGEPVDRFFDAISDLGDKAGPFLWQLSPTFHRDDERLAAFVSVLPGIWRHAFEFRHPSWLCQEVYDILDNAGAALCIPDSPRYGKAFVLTTDWTYIRMHYGGTDGKYTDGELDGWAQRIRGYLQDGNDVYVYFNNDWEGYALENARRLKRKLKS